jgi:hypothetical protein
MLSNDSRLLKARALLTNTVSNTIPSIFLTIKKGFVHSKVYVSFPQKIKYSKK